MSPPKPGGQNSAPARFPSPSLDDSAALQYGVTATQEPIRRVLEEGQEAPSALWEEVTLEFQSYIGQMAEANERHPTVVRRSWLGSLNELWLYLAASPAAITDAELHGLRRGLQDLRSLFSEEHGEAVDLFEYLTGEYQAERTDLVGSEMLEDVAALGVLEAAYKKTERRVDTVGAFLIAEDLLAFHHMLDTERHIKLGHDIAREELKSSSRLEETFEQEPEVAVPSPGEIAWEVVGWSSPGDFAGDVLLMAFTAGTGKVVKWVAKVRKAKKRMAALRKLTQARKMRAALRQKRLAQAIARLPPAIWEALNVDGREYALWVKANWTSTARRYVTDELGMVLAEWDPQNDVDILDKLNKDRIEAFLADALGFSAKLEVRQLDLAVFAYAAGMNGYAAKLLRRYFVMNLKRRLLGNVVFNGLRVGIGQRPLSTNLIVDIGTKTVGEMVQDFAKGITKFDIVAETVVEIARKALQQSVAIWIKTGLN